MVHSPSPSCFLDEHLQHHCVKEDIISVPKILVLVLDKLGVPSFFFSLISVYALLVKVSPA